MLNSKGKRRKFSVSNCLNKIEQGDPAPSPPPTWGTWRRSPERVLGRKNRLHHLTGYTTPRANMDDPLASSALDFSPVPSKPSGGTRGVASFAKIFESAREDRITTKCTVKQLEFGYGVGTQKQAGAEPIH